MNEQARALLLAGVTLFGAGNGSGYMLARSTAPVAVAPVVAPVAAPTPRPGDNSPATPHQKAATPSPRAAAPPPRIRAPAPIVRERPPAQKKRTTTPTRQRTPTAAECTLMRVAGKDRVLREGRARGYSTTQISGALRHCGL